jgi:biotin operon repressor
LLYQRSMSIERRLVAVLRLIETENYSTPMISETLGISIPTVSRHVSALRERGFDIRSQRRDGVWRFILVRKQASPSFPRDVESETVGASRRGVDPGRARIA